LRFDLHVGRIETYLPIKRKCSKIEACQDQGLSQTRWNM